MTVHYRMLPLPSSSPPNSSSRWLGEGSAAPPRTPEPTALVDNQDGDRAPPVISSPSLIPRVFPGL